jgi:hypothetical protein
LFGDESVDASLEGAALAASIAGLGVEMSTGFVEFCRDRVERCGGGVELLLGAAGVADRLLCRDVATDGVFPIL